MNKMELIQKVAKDANVDMKTAVNTVNALFGAVTESLAKGEKVSVLGFGTFETRTRAARSGRNPRTGEAVQIEEMRYPAFRPGKALKDQVK